jgi:hypothetical protein
LSISKHFIFLVALCVKAEKKWLAYLPGQAAFIFGKQNL